MDGEDALDPGEVLPALFAASNRHDLDTVMSFFVDDCEYLTPRGRRPWGRRVKGKEDVRLAMERQFGRYQQARYVDPEHWVMDDDRAFSTWTIVGMTADGEPAEVWGCDVWTFRGGKVVLRSSFWKFTRPQADAGGVTRTPRPGAAPRSPPPAQE
jgi:ketosteroid isomerase-like protein